LSKERHRKALNSPGSKVTPAVSDRKAEVYKQQALARERKELALIPGVNNTGSCLYP
jgi:hypothetical protein